MVINMFTNYILKNDILYLEIDIKYEFGSNKKIKNKNILDEIKEYINKTNIKDKFNKIVITCSGIIIGTIIFLNGNDKITQNNIKYVPNISDKVTFSYNNEDKEFLDTTQHQVINENIEIIDENSNSIDTISNDNYIQNDNYTESNINYLEENNYQQEYSIPIQNLITVHRSNGTVISIDLEEYVIGVVAAEMPASFNIEALKAQSVLARTYALKAKQDGKILTDTVSTQSYIDTNQMINKWGGDFDYYFNKIKNATLSTSGEYLTYDGNYIEALYHSTNNGKTESSLDVFGYYYPYLISVSSEFDKNASSYLRTINMDLNTISSKLGINLNSNSLVEILSYTDGGNIKEINIDGNIFTGRKVRELLGIRSADFDINIDDTNASITTRGFGHGVGMSQYGSNGMANAGYSYMDILYHYYPGTYLN